MKIFRLLLVLGVTSLSAACTTDSGVASRNQPLETGFAASGAVVRDYAVQDVRVSVPYALSVSEANTYFPFADIVWRGDVFGNRHYQLAVLFEEAAARGAEQLEGAIPVIAEVELRRFHGVTEKTRFSFGGDYDVQYMLTVRHALTGEVLEPAHLVKDKLDAPGGSAAMALDRAGLTERVRVMDFMTQRFLQDLSGPALGA